MPDDSKKSQDKKHDPKEQRKPRNPRNQTGNHKGRVEKVEESKSAPKVIPQKLPVYEDLGPDCKIKTDEILKIAEEESSKYKKKEIQSNWSKYEMPIESYDEIEDVGADYEKLIQAPLSVGGHFQFKHEKSWDANTGPTLYDKYFDINTDNLSLAISTIPFHERYDIDKRMFTETDMVNMNKRAAKFNEKYLRYISGNKNSSSTDISNDSDKTDESTVKDLENESVEKDINLDFSNLKIHLVSTPPIHSREVIKENVNKPIDINTDSIDHVIEQSLNVEGKIKQDLEIENAVPAKEKEISSVNKPEITENNNDVIKVGTKVKVDVKPDKVIDIDQPVVTNPVVESPEDLEKWLDDFLDG